MRVYETTADAVEVEVRGYSAESMAAELASFGDHVEVLRPAQVRTGSPASEQRLPNVTRDEARRTQVTLNRPA